MINLIIQQLSRQRDLRKIDVSTVRELRGVMASEEVTEGVLATTGEFTAEARMFYSKNGISPLTGQAFMAKFNDLPPTERRRILAEVLDGDYTTPSCPQCEKNMVWRDNGGLWSCATSRKCGSTPIHARKTRKLQIPARDEAGAFYRRSSTTSPKIRRRLVVSR